MCDSPRSIALNLVMLTSLLEDDGGGLDQHDKKIVVELIIGVAIDTLNLFQSWVKFARNVNIIFTHISITSNVNITCY